MLKTNISIKEPLCYPTPSHIDSGTLINGDKVSVTQRESRGGEIDVWINGKHSDIFYDYEFYLDSSLYKELHRKTEGAQDNVSKECRSNVSKDCIKIMRDIGEIAATGILIGFLSCIRLLKKHR